MSCVVFAILTLFIEQIARKQVRASFLHWKQRKAIIHRPKQSLRHRATSNHLQNKQLLETSRKKVEI